jgi:hypothetical protein
MLLAHRRVWAEPVRQYKVGTRADATARHRHTQVQVMGTDKLEINNRSWHTEREECDYIKKGRDERLEDHLPLWSAWL